MKLAGMKLAGMMNAAVLCLTIGMAAPLYAQEQHDQDEQKTSKPEDDKAAQPDKAKQEDKSAQPEKEMKPEEKRAQDEKNAKPEEKTARQEDNNKKQDEPAAKSTAHTAENHGGRIPEDRYKANFGQAHTFRVNQSEYSNRSFQSGGYSFEFLGAWPSNWLYTQDVYVIEINGTYYLCNPMYPGVNIALLVTM